MKDEITVEFQISQLYNKVTKKCGIHKNKERIVEIKRDAYLEQLKIRRDNGMIKIRI